MSKMHEAKMVSLNDQIRLDAEKSNEERLKKVRKQKLVSKVEEKKAKKSKEKKDERAKK